MLKRKKEAKLKLVPENQRIFKGLRFYYIPNDDANGVRRHQINKAKEHGATWVRTLAEASHIIVDQDLTYKDIKPDITSDPSALTKIIVNASYPTDCVAYRMLLEPDQGKYIRNLSTSEETAVMKPPNQEMTSRQNPRASPNPKPRRSLRRGQESSSSSRQDSGQQHEEPQEINTESNIPTPKVPTSLADDELSQCIGLVKNDSIRQQVPLEEEDEDSRNGYLKDDIVDSQYESSDDERVKKKQKRHETVGQQKTSWQDNFACMKGGTEGGDASNPNARTIELLQAMADQYEKRDHFRCLSYRKAITTLGQQDHKITTAKEAIKLPNIGESLADKIEEIVADDRLRKLEDAKQQPEDIITNIFLKIYGVGISQARKWVSQGYRTLEDLKEKAQLTPSQVIGIEHYDDLNKRIPRWEVEALAEVVKKATAALDASIELIIGGSYRRGAESSGDIDIIITKKKTKTTPELLPFLEKLVRRLTDQGFLTASLASFSGKAGKGHGSKWHGCCVLPEAVFPKDKGQYQPIWRRIDLLLVPESEAGAALIYFTGNDIFNRSIRLLASKKGMRLNQRGLYKDVLRGPGRVKYTDGALVEARDEKKIFELLGVKWREPHERWC
ncbi:hypothetical protein SLS62_009480 [Diatrype stigma]|uniref:DNA polymerase n=1 Tax=Diatrype stigma TaxID=117547 RepID=A0AAN9UDJ4_9PEZI